MRHFAALIWVLLACAPAGAQEARIAMIDGFAPFYDPEKPAPRSWAMPFSHIDTREAPYVDQAHLERALGRFGAYCEHVARRGYDTVFVGNLIHLASFDGVAAEGLPPVYPPDSPFRARAKAYRAAFRRAAEMARTHGLRLVVETDFPAWTPPLRAWLGGGGLGLDNPRLWVAMRAALRELFGDVGAWGLSVRIGEGGGAYDEGTGYASSITVRTVAETQAAIEGLVAAVEAYDAAEGGAHRLFFRTWTIGIGEIGALHTDPDLYQQVFAPFAGRAPLVTVIKHVAMDFFAHVPLNPTIGVGELPQLVEFQARREYEGFGLFPNYRAEPFRRTIAEIASRKNFAGISVWPLNGGFLLPARTAYRTQGVDAWIDQNVHAYGALLAQPGREPRALAEAWAREQGLGAADAQRYAKILLKSDELIAQGLYLGPYAERAPALFGLDVFPTMLWFYWTRPVGAYGVQALLFHYARDEIPRGLAEGSEALAACDALIAEAEALGPTAQREQLLAALQFERSLLAIFAAYRRVFLNHHAWAHDGEAQAYTAWRTALPELEEAMRAHEETYAHDPEHPAFDLRELKRLLHDDARIPGLRPLAGILALIAIGLAGILLGLPDRLREAPSPASLLLAGGGSALPGFAAAVLCAGYEAPWVAAVVAIPSLVLWGLGLLSLLPGRSAAERVAPLHAAGCLAVPALLLAGAVLGTFALRGPVPVYALLVGSLLDPLSAWLLGGLVGALLLGQLGAGVLAAQRAGQRGATRVVGPLAVLLLWAALCGGALAQAGTAGFLHANRVFRLAPSILGEAGTGVEDLVAAPGED